jgi:hypothetical protein
MLYFLDAPTRRIVAGAANREPADDLTDVPEGLARPGNA